MNFFIYPMKNMRITQSYTGVVSHKPHWYNVSDYKDYPIDDGGEDGRREALYCPCDEMVVTDIKGVADSLTTNTIWLVSTSHVKTPTFEDYAFMTLTHSNDSDFTKIRVGTKFKRGDIIVHEGEDGGVATHIHMTFGRGSSNNWRKNSNGKLVILGDTKRPEEVCYLDTKFTKVYNKSDISWTELPKYLGKVTSRNQYKNQVEVIANNLRIRSSSTLEGDNILGYANVGIYDVIATANNNGYVWYMIGENMWIAYDSTWAKFYPLQRDEEETKNDNEVKDENEEQDESQPAEDNAENDDDLESEVTNSGKKIFLKFLIDFFKKIWKFILKGL